MLEVYLLNLRANGPEQASAAALIPITRFPCVLGRAPECDRRVNDASISRRHCVFTLRDDQAWVEDLGSSNGTRLNGEALTGARPIEDGDRIDLARLSFQARLRQVQASEAEQPSQAQPVDEERATEATFMCKPEGMAGNPASGLSPPAS
jgi:pSer/pThr/pTyr-binding forkhead associated (FHA) protein